MPKSHLHRNHPPGFEYDEPITGLQTIMSSNKPSLPQPRNAIVLSWDAKSCLRHALLPATVFQLQPLQSSTVTELQVPPAHRHVAFIIRLFGNHSCPGTRVNSSTVAQCYYSDSHIFCLLTANNSTVMSLGIRNSLKQLWYFGTSPEKSSKCRPSLDTSECINIWGFM